MKKEYHFTLDVNVIIDVEKGLSEKQLEDKAIDKVFRQLFKDDDITDFNVNGDVECIAIYDNKE